MRIPYRFTFFIFAVATLFFSTTASAQYYEVGWSLGTSNYVGDFQNSYFAPTEYHLSFGMMGRYNATPRWSFKAAAVKSAISGSDANYADYNALRRRNLNFRADIFEVAATAEFNLLPYYVRAGLTSTPYVFAGISGFHFNPQAEKNGVWVDLQPLGTEGQTMYKDVKKYNLIQAALPVGIGFKFALNNRVNLGLEFGYRFTFTDYLDDVSGYYPDIQALAAENPEAAALSFRQPEYEKNEMQNPMGTKRGDNKKTDGFFTAGVQFSVNLGGRSAMEFDKKYKAFKD